MRHQASHSLNFAYPPLNAPTGFFTGATATTSCNLLLVVWNDRVEARLTDAVLAVASRVINVLEAMMVNVFARLLNSIAGKSSETCQLVGSLCNIVQSSQLYVWVRAGYWGSFLERKQVRQ